MKSNRTQLKLIFETVLWNSVFSRTSRAFPQAYRIVSASIVACADCTQQSEGVSLRLRAYYDSRSISLVHSSEIYFTSDSGQIALSSSASARAVVATYVSGAVGGVAGAILGYSNISGVIFFISSCFIPGHASRIHEMYQSATEIGFPSNVSSFSSLHRFKH